MSNLLRQLIREMVHEHLSEVVHLHVPETQQEKKAFMNLMMQLAGKIEGAEEVAKEALEKDDFDAALDMIRTYLALKRIPFAMEKPAKKVGPLKL